MSISLRHLEQGLKAAWSAATSYDARNWSRDNAAYGQCAVTACVVQDYLGGEIVWAEAVLPDGEKVSHFFNRLNGVEVDLTRGQFPAGTIIATEVDYPHAQSSRAHILAYPDTVRRYETLKHNTARALKGMA